MTMAATILSNEARTTLLDTLIKKAEQACFVDWIVGLSLAAYYAPPLMFGATYEPEMIYAIAALACTRAGDTIVRAVRDFAYWKYAKRMHPHG